MEVWRWVRGYRGRYQVSNIGRVRSVPRVVQYRQTRSSKAAQHHRSLRGLLRKLTVDRWGYLRVNLCREGEKRRHNVHVLVLEAFVGPRPVGMECRHLDGNPANNHVQNLCWGTPKENGEDRVRHGTCAGPVGELHPRAKLTERDVLNIRRLSSAGRPKTELSQKHKVSLTMIYDIVNRKSWKHV